MERKPPRDAQIRLRVRSDALAQIDALAEEEQRTRSDMTRLLIAEGLRSWQGRARVQAYQRGN
jgi:hypothetical protein